MCPMSKHPRQQAVKISQIQSDPGVVVLRLNAPMYGIVELGGSKSVRSFSLGHSKRSGKFR